MNLFFYLREQGLTRSQRCYYRLKSVKVVSALKFVEVKKSMYCERNYSSVRSRSLK